MKYYLIIAILLSGCTHPSGLNERQNNLLEQCGYNSYQIRKDLERFECRLGTSVNGLQCIEEE